MASVQSNRSLQAQNAELLARLAELEAEREQLPLILAALPEHHHVFHEVSHNALLVSEGIRVSPDALSAEGLRGLAWTAMEPRYQERLAHLRDEFRQAKSKGLGSDELVQVAEASASGRIGTLLIEAERQIAGRLESATGQVGPADMSDPNVDDLLDDLGAGRQQGWVGAGDPS